MNTEIPTFKSTTLTINRTVCYLFSALITNTALALDYGDPTAQEQAHLEAINRARANPLQEAQRLGIDLFEGVPTGALTNSDPVQPLSTNAILINVARAHSDDMLKQNYFAHNDLTGKTPFVRIKDAGYVYRTAGENLGYIGNSAPLNETETALKLHDNLFIDEGVTGRGHRLNILNPNFREIGVGLSFGPFSQNGRTFNSGILTTDFGTRASDKPIIVGVVYDDQNTDQRYTAGEGLSTVTVATAATNSTQTASAGGYALEVDPNTTYTLTFTHPTYGTVSKSVQVDTLNVKVDLLSSAFGNNTANNNQCATFTGTDLSIPCITVAGTPFSAKLSVTNNNPLQFTLQSSAVNTPASTAQCGNYAAQTNTAHLNCVIVGQNHYWADLQLKGSVFELSAYGSAP